MKDSMMEWVEKEGNYFEKFHQEIKTWVDGELLKKKEWEARGKTGEVYNIYADDINPDLLTEEDMRMWNEVKSGGDPTKEFQEYNNRLNYELIDANNETRRSRAGFRDLLADKIVVKNVKEAQDEHYKKEG